MADSKEKEVFKYGVKKEIIEDRISKYEEIQNQDLGDKSPITALNILEIQFNDLIKEEEAAKDDSEREEKLAKLKQKRKEIEEKVNQINQENKEVLKANDVIEELEDLLKTSKEEYSFVEIEEIEKRIEEYKKMLFNLDSSALGKRKSELEALIAKQKEELEKLKENAAKKDDKTSVEPGKEYLDSATEKAKKDLEDKILDTFEVESPCDILMMDIDEIMMLEGFAEKSADNLYKALQKARAKQPLNRIMYSAAIPLVGRDASKRICETYSLLDLMAIFEKEEKEAIKDLTSIKNIGIEIATSLYKHSSLFIGLSSYINSIEEIKKLQSNKEQLSFCITGQREPFKTMIEEAGHKVTGSVSKKTVALIDASGDLTTTKATRALELNIPIIQTKEQLEELL